MNALVLVGSPKGRNSSSFLLASKMAEGMRKHGAAVREELVHAGLRSEEATLRLLDAVDAADLLVFSFPLYVDSLPSPLTRLVERIAVRRAGAAGKGSTRLAVMVQCGFPESRQCDTAIGICRLFAERTGMHWSGALAMGMGGSLGQGFEKLPAGGRDILRALDMASESLAKGGRHPRGGDEALRQASHAAVGIYPVRKRRVADADAEEPGRQAADAPPSRAMRTARPARVPVGEVCGAPVYSPPPQRYCQAIPPRS